MQVEFYSVIYYEWKPMSEAEINSRPAEIPYAESWERIRRDSSTSDAQKQEARRKLLETLGVKRYCCRMRLISSVYEEQKLVPRAA